MVRLFLLVRTPPDRNLQDGMNKKQIYVYLRRIEQAIEKEKSIYLHFDDKNYLLSEVLITHAWFVTCHTSVLLVVTL